ncbi:Hint domain-containing protein [Rhodobacter maris]|uniref:Ca2+-binding RTX toxin-like protein n=1 Tax=Rhodobacter maris TaxID=446682 RepID=A0A285SFX8_9RHOB|nr:Hint domain-containing protein [Rhodobacter maris]SOC04781.1 Ca2+-binding RTX toxin-like protein [Rhodobacter maris]
MTTWTIQGFSGSDLIIAEGGSTLSVGSNFMLDPTWDASTDATSYTFTDPDDTNLSGDNLNNEHGNDGNQTINVYDSSGTLIHSGQVYIEDSAVFTAPDGSSITLYTLEVNGVVVGTVTSAPLVPGVTYHVTAINDVTTGPLYTALASTTYDPDLANTVTGGDYADSITGGAGNDTITTGAGSDTIDGGTGNDSIQFGTGGDSVHGGDGNDYIDDYAGSTGYVYNDTLYGDAGNDTIFAGSGNDYVDGGADNDNIYGEDGNDTLLGGAGCDWIEGGAGADSIDGGTGTDIILGGDGNDTIHGGDGADYLAGNTGNDVLYGEADADRFYFENGWGSDTVYGGSTTTAGGVDLDTLDFSYDTVSGVSVTFTDWEDGTATDGTSTVTFDNIEGIYGTAFGDTINASADGSGLTLDGQAGNDSIIGGSGDDCILGGAGDDTIFSGFGNDTVYGGDGNDSIDDKSGVLAETYTNYVDAGAGNDTVFTGGGSDTILGGEGDDQLHAEAGDDLVYGGAGADTLWGNEGADTLWGGDGADSILGGIGDDLIYGEAGNDTITGGDGADSISGGADNDVITGDLGDDTLAGGTGADTLTGGTGADTYVMSDGDGADTVTDFDMTMVSGLTTDQFDVSGLKDAEGNPVNVWDVTVDSDEQGNAVLFFPDGTSVTLIGVSKTSVNTAPMLHAMGIPCLVAGSPVATPRGPVAVEQLVPGDLVITASGAAEPVLWTGARAVTAAEMAADPRLLPVEIGAGRLGNAAPVRLSALHAVHVPARGGALARAGHMAATGWGGARILHGLARQEAGLRYHHLLLPRHALISVAGLWVESFWPGRQGLAGLDPASRTRLIRARPQLAQVLWGGASVAACYSQPAAPFLRRREIDRAACSNWSLLAREKPHSDGFQASSGQASTL